MRNMLIIAREDLRRLFMNVVSVVITIALVIMPSLYW